MKMVFVSIMSCVVAFATHASASTRREYSCLAYGRLIYQAATGSTDAYRPEQIQEYMNNATRVDDKINDLYEKKLPNEKKLSDEERRKIKQFQQQSRSLLYQVLTSSTDAYRPEQISEFKRRQREICKVLPN